MVQIEARGGVNYIYHELFAQHNDVDDQLPRSCTSPPTSQALGVIHHHSRRTHLRRLHLRLLRGCHREHGHLPAQPTERPQVFYVISNVRFLHISSRHMRVKASVGNSTKECARRHCCTDLHECRYSGRLYHCTAPHPTRIPTNSSKAGLEQNLGEDAHHHIRPSSHRYSRHDRLHYPILLHSQPETQIHCSLDPTRRNYLHDSLQHHGSGPVAAIITGAASP